MSSLVGSEERLNPATGNLDAKDPGDLGAWNGNGPLGLWNSENCPIPIGHEPDILLIALREYLESLGFDSNFKLLAVVGDITDPDRIPKRHVDILTPLGVEFSSAPKDAEGKVPKDAADNFILKKLLRYNKRGARVPLIVVAGDGIYTPYLKNLVAKNYDVVWIYPHNKTSTDTLLTLSPFARICYEDLMWTHMRLEHIRSGTGPTPTRGGLGGKRAVPPPQEEV